ncbi:MAG TPA: DUF1549 domain-containing protein [Pirellulales bacterium]|jgi:hypothetical protein|nr:DUF1549 domain-containing protein [Pirellulales bacterium]
MKYALALLVLGLSASGAAATEVIPPASERFAADGGSAGSGLADSGSAGAEVPNFQRHVLPLMGRLGCNGRACHGSFQGQGGFRLSLFGYDFDADHKALCDGDEPRTDLKKPRQSLMLVKPTSADKDEHGGGKRMDVDSWQYRLLLRWVEAGAPSVDPQHDPQFVRMDVTPAELVFEKAGQTAQLRVVSVWSDGTREDVTPLCRFQTNDESVAKVDVSGTITVVGRGDTHIVAFYDNGVVPVPVLLPVSDSVGPRYPNVPTPTKIDELVVTKLRKLGIVPSDLCTDAEFLRRVSFDITGTLPPPDEVQAFLADTSADKRARKVDELLSRPAYAAWWSTRLCDFTGNNERSMPEQTARAEYAEQWYRWVDRRLAENTPYDKIVEGLVMAVSRSPGESYVQYAQHLSNYLRKDHPDDYSTRDSMPHYWSRTNMRTSNEKALSFSYAFLGVRLQCAECHKHPFDQWSQEDFKHFTAFFDRVKFGISSGDQPEYKRLIEALGYKTKGGAKEQRKAISKAVAEGKPAPLRELYIAPTGKGSEGKAKGEKKDKKRRVEAGRVLTPKVLGGEEVIADQYSDPRQPLMDWLRQDDNPYFARAIVNRVWSAYFNVGIVEPPDDMNLANPPSNRELLDWLSREFVAHSYDLKWLHRTIAGSRTYQLGWKPNATSENDVRNFSHAVPRRLPAEVVYDAVLYATAGNEELARLNQDPIGLRSIGVSPGYTQPAARSKVGYALSVFGKPRRETTCDCERSNDPTLLQTVFLRNDNEALKMIDRPDGWLAQTLGALAKRPAVEPTAASSQDASSERVRELERRLAKAKKQGDKLAASKLRKEIQTAKDLARKLEARKREIANEKRSTGDAWKNVTLDASAESGLVQQAYLRTLSRMPASDEVANALQYLADNGHRAGGLRDLLWALLNTKEFVINH